MTHVRYIGIHPEVESIALGVVVERGEPVEVTDPVVAAELLAQPVWEAVPAKDAPKVSTPEPATQATPDDAPSV